MDVDSCKAGQIVVVVDHESCSIVDTDFEDNMVQTLPDLVAKEVVVKDHKCQTGLKVVIDPALEFSSCLEAS